MGGMRHHTANAAFFVKCLSQHCGFAKGLSQHCGTGVSPVSTHGPEARATEGFSAGSNSTAQSPSVAPVGGCGFRAPLPQGSLRFALGFIPSPLRGWNPVDKTTLRYADRPRRGVTLLELLVIMSVFALLFSILMPVLGETHSEAGVADCLARLRKISTCTAMYMANQQGQAIIPWYQYPPHQGYSVTWFTPWVFGGFKAPNPDPAYGYESDFEKYPAEIRPLNNCAAHSAQGDYIIDLYIDPADQSYSSIIIGQPPEEEESQVSTWERNGSSYTLNTRWAQGYALPSGNFGLGDFHIELGTYPRRIAKHMLGGEASAFIVWGEQSFYSATYRAGPTIAGIGGGSQPLRYGWHGKFSQWSVGFADGHAVHGFFDTRQIYGLDGTIWQPNYAHGL